jgi:hypothetical protein
VLEILNLLVGRMMMMMMMMMMMCVCHDRCDTSTGSLLISNDSSREMRLREIMVTDIVSTTAHKTWSSSEAISKLCRTQYNVLPEHVEIYVCVRS